MIKYNIIPVDNTERIVYSLVVDPPLQNLSVVSNLHEDIEDFIEWLEELIDRNIYDASELGSILYQEILWGSHKSKIAQLNDDGTVSEGAEFETKDLLQLLKNWQQFLNDQS